MARKVDKATKLFSKYLQQRKITIADPSGASRAGLAKAMVSLGARTNLITMLPDFHSAVETITQKKPDVVLCDFDLGGRSGLELLQTQRESNPNSKNSLFILITGNTSQAAVAQAAEEDVDAYILKPYTLDIFKASLIRAAIKKIYPSPYVQSIEKGKKLLFEGKVAEAQEVLEKAIPLDPKPSLAYFYLGQVNLMKKALDPAQDHYQKGLAFNKIHYKCLVGLFDLLMKRESYDEAYNVIKRIARYFPANPKRLTTVLRLAIMTKSYDDIERYYQNFVKMDERNDELIKYICAALVVTGKFYLKQNVPSRALQLFQKAGVTASGRTKILREIVTTLCDHGLHKEADPFLTRFPPSTQKGQDFLAMKFLIDSAYLSSSIMIDKGRKLIKDGIHDPAVYKLLIHYSQQTGLIEYSEKLQEEAKKRWPKLRAQFKTKPPQKAA